MCSYALFREELSRSFCFFEAEVVHCVPEIERAFGFIKMLRFEAARSEAAFAVMLNISLMTVVFSDGLVLSFALSVGAFDG